MKREKRQVYAELCKEISAELCLFCRFVEAEGNGCCECYCICRHPLPVVQEYQEIHTPIMDDCWAFRPILTISDVADIAGKILAEGWYDWIIRLGANNTICLDGRRLRQDVPDA